MWQQWIPMELSMLNLINEVICHKLICYLIIFRMCRSSSRDTYLSVPSNRKRGTSLTEEGSQRVPAEADLYRLRKFIVSNKKIISHTESFQLRSNRSVNSMNSSASRWVVTIVRPPYFADTCIEDSFQPHLLIFRKVQLALKHRGRVQWVLAQ